MFLYKKEPFAKGKWFLFTVIIIFLVCLEMIMWGLLTDEEGESNVKIEHVAMYVNELESVRDFFVKYRISSFRRPERSVILRSMSEAIW